MMREKISTRVILLLVLIGALGGCNHEPKDDNGFTPQEISKTTTSHLSSINPFDTLLEARTYKYSNDKYLIFVLHYNNPKKSDFVREFGVASADYNKMTTPYIAQKKGDVWDLSYPTLTIQKLEDINVRKYKYCAKRLENDLKDIFCGEDVNDAIARIRAGSKVGWIDKNMVEHIVLQELEAQERLKK
jgi:hypothetical protein